MSYQAEPAEGLSYSGAELCDRQPNPNLRDISLTIDGHEVTSRIYADGYTTSIGWISGTAVVLVGRAANNFLFVDSDYPSDVDYRAYFLSTNICLEDIAYRSGSDVYSYASSFWSDGRSALSVTAADVPEPAMLGLFGLGAIGLGLSHLRKG